jgi:hypothetical protein
MDPYFYPIRGGHHPPIMAPVSMLKGMVLVALGAAAAVMVDRLVLGSTPAEESVPAVTGNEPGPGDPPVVWLDGSLEEVSESQIVIREGQGPRLEVERFAAGATSFLRQDGEQWVVLGDQEVQAIRTGQPACLETLLDGRTFLALRVFLGVDCGPAG